MKLRDDSEPRLEAASEPRLDVNDPRLLPEEQDSVLADRLRHNLEQKAKVAVRKVFQFSALSYAS